LEAVPTRIVQLETGGLLAALVQASLYLDLCETGHASNHGIHRVSTGAQRFVIERWLHAMGDHKINIVELFGYDSAVFDAAKRDEWFAERSDPHIAHPVLEEEMNRFLYEASTNLMATKAGR